MTGASRRKQHSAANCDGTRHFSSKSESPQYRRVPLPNCIRQRGGKGHPSEVRQEQQGRATANPPERDDRGRDQAPKHNHFHKRGAPQPPRKEEPTPQGV